VGLARELDLGNRISNRFQETVYRGQTRNPRETYLAPFKTIKVGKPLNIDDLKRQSTPRARRANPRDEDLLRLVDEVSVGPTSEVVPWHFDGKAATARAAATKVIRASGAKVYASSRPDMPGVLLFSRVPLTGRQGKKPVTPA
jgi:hypothetical protein